MATQFVRGEPFAGGPVQTHPGAKHAGGVVEVLAAAAGVALAIIGLVGVAPRFLDTIAVIVLGVAFLLERWTVTARMHEGTLTGIEARGLTAESVAGWTGVVLGILSLLRLVPTILAPIALIVFGAGLALGSGIGTRSGRLLVGIGAIVLGILSLIQLDPRTLTLVGLIGVGAILMLSGPAIARASRHAPHPAT